MTEEIDLFDSVQCGNLSKERLIELIREGMTGAQFEKLASESDLSQIFAAALGVSVQKIAQIYQQELLTQHQTETVLDTFKLIQFAGTVWSDWEMMNRWLRCSVAALSDQKPIQLLDTFEGRKWVSQVLSHIEDGSFT